MSGAAKLLGLTWDEAHGVMERAVKRGLAAREEIDPKVIGVDEKCVGRGLRVFTLVCATRSRLEPVKKVASMVKHHVGGILACYNHRVTDALSEGINSNHRRLAFSRARSR